MQRGGEEGKDKVRYVSDVKSSISSFYIKRIVKTNWINLKFGDGDGPNLCRVKKSSTFIENIFRSGLTIVISNFTRGFVNYISNKLSHL